MNKIIQILNTRALRQAKITEKELSHPHFNIINCPAIEIIAKVNFQQDINRILSKPGNIYIFISANAVWNSLEIIKNKNSLRNIIAVGNATKAALESYGYNNILTPKTAESAAILELPIIKDKELLDIVIFSGEPYKDYLENKLLEKKHNVVSYKVYERKICLNSVQQLNRTNNIDNIIVFSRETLLALNKLISISGNFSLKKACLITIDDDIRKLAIKLGFNHNICVLSDESTNTRREQILDFTKVRDI